MTKATINITFEGNNTYLFHVVGLAVEQLKEGVQKGKVQRNGITAEFEQEIIIDYEKMFIRHENGNIIIKSKL
jgi:hypothetical protein